ncbi:hypothetical protein POM88_022103 [Heracleum sosnowskyi]|uniref:Uncharacterized protein n=1 Tax=Heracleum sosnowskyi TaxID=360622 RepID=A0AAD8IFV8_9APIA|nr:hypothetical protein POM88_022103 [Heracleum sosnowskyi]
MDKDKRVSFGNGIGGNESLGKDKKVSFDIATCRSFRPYGRHVDMNVVNGKSDASSGGSSPAVSDHHNSSLQGALIRDVAPFSTRNPTDPVLLTRKMSPQNVYVVQEDVTKMLASHIMVDAQNDVDGCLADNTVFKRVSSIHFELQNNI